MNEVCATQRVTTCAFLLLFTAACAKRAPEPAGVPSGLPHVSWIIMHGDRDNPDSEFACQSTGPRECVLPASRPGARVFSEVHFYFHGAGAETTYLGTFSADFLNDGDAAHAESAIKASVRGTEDLANHSIIGVVTQTAGRYKLRLALDAQTQTATTPIAEEVAVEVR